MGEFKTSDNTDFTNGVSNKVSYYKSVLNWPESMGSEIVKDQVIKNSIVRLETDKLYIYFAYYSDVLMAEKEHRKIYDQINGCAINLMSGNVYTLVAGYNERMIDFNQLFNIEKIDIALEFATNKNGMFYNYLVISRRK
jgi:hypothetical protein